MPEYVIAGKDTFQPGPTPKAKSSICNAIVAELVTYARASVSRWISISRFSANLPEVSQPERITFRTTSFSAFPSVGGANSIGVSFRSHRRVGFARAFLISLRGLLLCRQLCLAADLTT